ncbi:hypothetical protein B0H13DRAFT_1888491 [Mycena leptocephala]|nr:hypothetical protein B0H13DRAFT_1888491 [Mycena leptocephala]
MVRVLLILFRVLAMESVHLSFAPACARALIPIYVSTTTGLGTLCGLPDITHYARLAVLDNAHVSPLWRGRKNQALAVGARSLGVVRCAVSCGPHSARQDSKDVETWGFSVYEYSYILIAACLVFAQRISSQQRGRVCICLKSVRARLRAAADERLKNNDWLESTTMEARKMPSNQWPHLLRFNAGIGPTDTENTYRSTCRAVSYTLSRKGGHRTEDRYY